LLASLVGKFIVNAPLDADLFAPKSRTHTALLLFVLLYINAPLAVKVTPENVKGLNCVVAVEVDFSEGATLTSVPPPAL
jgi:hypothetical protein